MRIAHDTRFWIVRDPASGTTDVASLLVETSLRDLELQFKGGMTCGRDAVIYTDRAEAERDARGRIEAWEAYREALRANEEQHDHLARGERRS
jgi:hypothetical protein